MCETSVLLFQCVTHDKHDAGCAREHLLGGAHNAPGEGGHQPGDGAGEREIERYIFKSSIEIQIYMCQLIQSKT